MNNPFSGVIPVLPTPFLANGEVDHDSFRNVLQHLRSLNVGGVMFPGFASEFYKLTEAERRAMIAEVVDQTAGSGTKAIIAVQAHATRVAIDEAKSFIEQGADALNLLPPHYMSPSSDAILEHCANVLREVPGTPVILQYAPSPTAPISPNLIATLAREHSNLVAVKVESRPPYGLIEALSAGEDAVPCFAGSGGLFMLDSLRLGAIGVQPGSGFVEIYQHILDSWNKSDLGEAERVFTRLLRYLVGWANEQERMVAIEKTIAQRRGLIAHSLCRMPHRQLSPAEERSIDLFMSDFADFFEGTN